MCLTHCPQNTIDHAYSQYNKAQFTTQVTPRRPRPLSPAQFSADIVYHVCVNLIGWFIR